MHSTTFKSPASLRNAPMSCNPSGNSPVVDPQRYAFDPSTSLSAVTWSSFEGMEMSVKVAATFSRGQLVYDRGNLVGTPGHGFPSA